MNSRIRGISPRRIVALVVAIACHAGILVVMLRPTASFPLAQQELTVPEARTLELRLIPAATFLAFIWLSGPIRGHPRRVARCSPELGGSCYTLRRLSSHLVSGMAKPGYFRSDVGFRGTGPFR